MSSFTVKFSLLACLLALVFLGLQTAVYAQASEAQKSLARAVELHQSGDLEGAIREYKNFLLVYPNIAEVHSNLGAVYARLGRYEEAVQQYKQALPPGKDNPAVRFNLALGYYKMNRLDEAAAEFARVIRADAANKNATLLLADCFLRTGEFKKVIELLAPLEASFGDDRTLAYILGTALIRENQIEKGQVLIDRILRNGDSAEAHLMMGVAGLTLHDYPVAVKELRRALELNPKLPQANAFYGQALLGSGDRDGSLKAFEAEIENDPNDFEANLYMGILLKEDQKFEEALKYFQKALRIRPQELNVSYFIANADMALGNITEAHQLLEAVVKEAPDFVEAHVLLATVYYRLKRKADGDRERAIIQKLNAEKQAKAPGAKENLGPAYRGEQLPASQPVKKPEERRP